MEARRAHNPEVVGSSPASATIKNTGFRKKSGVFLLFEDIRRKQMEHYGNSFGSDIVFCKKSCDDSAVCFGEQPAIFILLFCKAAVLSFAILTFKADESKIYSESEKRGVCDAL